MNDIAFLGLAMLTQTRTICTWAIRLPGWLFQSKFLFINQMIYVLLGREVYVHIEVDLYFQDPLKSLIYGKILRLNKWPFWTLFGREWKNILLRVIKKTWIRNFSNQKKVNPNNRVEVFFTVTFKLKSWNIFSLLFR